MSEVWLWPRLLLRRHRRGGCLGSRAGPVDSPAPCSVGCGGSGGTYLRPGPLPPVHPAPEETTGQPRPAQLPAAQQRAPSGWGLSRGGPSRTLHTFISSSISDIFRSRARRSCEHTAHTGLSRGPRRLRRQVATGSSSGQLPGPSLHLPPLSPPAARSTGAPGPAEPPGLQTPEPLTEARLPAGPSHSSGAGHRGQRLS